MKKFILMLGFIFVTGCSSHRVPVNNIESDKTVRENGGGVLSKRLILSISGGFIVDGDRFRSYRPINLSMPHGDEVFAFAQVGKVDRIPLTLKFKEGVLSIQSGDVSTFLKVNGNINDGVSFKYFDIGDDDNIIFRKAVLYIRTDS